jgi:photosystem II stability/assembly factor-like uncharacterized protein
MRIAVLFFLIVSLHTVEAQPSSEADIQNSYQARKKLAVNSILKNYPVRNIGPTVQGARIVDIEVNNNNPKEFYVGYASGGIFRTGNNGITFEPVFDNQDALGIGDFALSQSDPKIIYVGTGEKNSSRSSYAGSGVYKTADGGKTWASVGLSSTQHISRVVIHPQNNNIVWVSVIGALYTKNEQRGVFKTMDGGQTWKKTLYINDSTGIIDIAVNPKNPDQLLASAWERSRKAWNFKGQGSSSGIYRSADGGENWTRSTAGFPEGKTVGRIGLKMSPSNPEIVYAVVDNHQELSDKKKEEKSADKIKASDFRPMSKENFLKLDDKKLDEFLKDSGFPKKYTAEIVKKEVREGKYSPKALAEYFGGDANDDLFKTKIAGAEVYRSGDGGQTWKKMNTYDLDGVFYTYGYYFSEIEVSPRNPEQLYIYGVPLLKSNDSGATWHRIDTLKGVNDVHVDHHALWSDPNDPNHLLLGNDGGLYQSYDEGATWLHINNTSVGQFYTVNVDMETPYNVYGGLQDNGVLKGSSRSVPNETKHWDYIFWGDGMCVAPDPRNHKLIYTGYQFGNYFRLEEKGKSTKITPQHDIGVPALRWNWRTPLFLSKHNPDIVYTAANKVFRSLNKGETWETISKDLTRDLKQENVPFSSIASLSESPVKFGLLYAGTDDGNLWVTKNGGGEWMQINAGLPSNKWISSVNPSLHDEATVFVSLNGYRDDDFRTMLFMSHDYGKTWKSIKANLPESVANVVIQDPVNADILYCGLDNGTYTSLDYGASWHLFNGMLNVASYDMIVHPRENELIVATHGRSVFIADVKPLQSLKNGAATPLMVFAPESIKYNDKWGEKEFPWDKPDNPFAEILYYVGKTTSQITAEVFDEKEKSIRKMTLDSGIGFHTWKWDLKSEQAQVTEKTKTKKASDNPVTLKYVEKGKYKIRLSNGSESSDTILEIK